MLLEEMTTLDVQEYLKKDKLVVIPIGATEQHGPANPLGTDFLIAQHVARKTCEITGTICAPTIPIAVSEHHSRFAGTVWLSPRLVREIMTEYSLNLASHGFDHIIFMNGHGGNTGALKEVANNLYYSHKMKAVSIDWWDFADTDGIKEMFPDSNFSHAEAIETSVGLAVHEHLIKLDTLEGVKPPTKWGREIAGIGIPSYTDDFSKSGIAGTLDNISKESGEKILEVVIAKFSDFISAFRNH